VQGGTLPLDSTFEGTTSSAVPEQAGADTLVSPAGVSNPVSNNVVNLSITLTLIASLSDDSVPGTITLEPGKGPPGTVVEVQHEQPAQLIVKLPVRLVIGEGCPR
jgi:hypothetical protein